MKKVQVAAASKSEPSMRKTMLKIDNELVLSNVYMKKQIDGEKLCKLVSKRKKVHLQTLHMWKYDRMHQTDIFSQPLVHGKLYTTQLVFSYYRKNQSHALNLAIL